MPTPAAIYALAAAPGGVCFAAAANGLYRSDDGGAAWREAYTALALPEPLPTSAVALSPTFSTDQTLFAGIHGAVLRSRNGGETWEWAALPTPPPLVSALAVSPNYLDDGVVFAASLEDGVFRSSDRGATWASWNFALLDLHVNCLAVSPAYTADETLFAATDSGVFASANGGRAWRELDFSMDDAPVLSLAISPAYAEDGTLYAGTEAAGLFRSTDAGQTWAPVGAGMFDDAVNALACGENGQLFAACGASLSRSTDNGQTWAECPLASGETEEAITAILAPAGDRAALVGLEESGVVALA